MNITLRKTTTTTSSSSSSSSSFNNTNNNNRRNSLREKQSKKLKFLKEERENTNNTNTKKIERMNERKGINNKRDISFNNNILRDYESELRDALRDNKNTNNTHNTNSSYFLKEATTTATKEFEKTMKKMQRKVKKVTKKTVQSAIDLLYPSSSTSTSSKTSPSASARFSTNSSFPQQRASSSPLYYNNKEPNILGFTGIPGAFVGWSLLISSAYVVMKLINGERVLPPLRGMKFFNSNNNNGNNNGKGKWVIDRSLGGRKVWVPDEGSRNNGNGNKLFSERSALDEVFTTSSFSEQQQQRQQKELQQKEKKRREEFYHEQAEDDYPTWWEESPFLYTSISGVVDGQRKSALLQDAKRSASLMSAARINGVQWTAEMIVDFYTACDNALKCYANEEKNKFRLSIAKSVGPENARVQLFRRASEMAVDDCANGRSGVSSGFGTDVNVFIVGLSHFLHLPTKTSINIVRSSCAVKIRNLLLVCCSAIRSSSTNNNDAPLGELLLSLYSIVSILKIFPFDDNSAEIEMINEGFKTRISEKERKELLIAYKEISDSVGDQTIEEALRL
jgi:hypothetical protein